MKFAWLFVLLSLVTTVVVLWIYAPSDSDWIDKAQAKFEKQERAKSRSYDFDAWRKAGDLKCQNAPTLRICQAMPVMASSHAGEEVYVARDFMSFACSTSECAWVDP